MQETELKLTKEQLEIAIKNHLNQQDGLHEVFSMTLNALMVAERSCFLESKEAKGNKANGYRSVSKQGLGKQLQLRIPRDRMGAFQPVIYGLIQSQEDQVKELSYALYGKGLTTRQISTILHQVYGKSYSKSTVSAITSSYKEIIEAWQNRPLDQHYLAVFIDAMYVKVRRGTVENEAYYTVLGLKKDLTREVLAVVNLPSESATGWKLILQNLKQRGVQQINLFVFDDLTGLDNAIGSVFQQGLQQKCTLHFQKNLSKHIRQSERAEFCGQMKAVFDPEQDINTETAVRQLKEFLNQWQSSYKSLTSYINRNDLELYFTYFSFHKSVRRMIYTTNWVERLNKSYRRTLKIRNALPSAQAAELLICYVAMEMEEKTYSYPVTNFKFDEKFLTWSQEY